MTLESLKSLDDGRIAAAFDAELARAIEDCQDRPADDKARTVNLTLRLRPQCETNAGLTECSGVLAEFEIAAKVPKRRSKRYELGVRKGGMVLFNDHNPTDFRQTSIDDLNRDGSIRREES